MDQCTGATLVCGGVMGQYTGATLVVWWCKWTSILELPWWCSRVYGPVYWSMVG